MRLHNRSISNRNKPQHQCVEKYFFLRLEFLLFLLRLILEQKISDPKRGKKLALLGTVLPCKALVPNVCFKSRQAGGCRQKKDGEE